MISKLETKCFFGGNKVFLQGKQTVSLVGAKWKHFCAGAKSMLITVKKTADYV
jgi:hypothetical protein